VKISDDFLTDNAAAIVEGIIKITQSKNTLEILAPIFLYKITGS